MFASSSAFLPTRRVMPNAQSFAKALRTGRDVYVAEACWHCHSQFVRPVSNEDLRFGPVSTPEEYQNDMFLPHLFGTRRIGPDLEEAKIVMVLRLSSTHEDCLPTELTARDDEAERLLVEGSCSFGIANKEHCVIEARDADWHLSGEPGAPRYAARPHTLRCA